MLLFSLIIFYLLILNMCKIGQSKFDKQDWEVMLSVQTGSSLKGKDLNHIIIIIISDLFFFQLEVISIFILLLVIGIGCSFTCDSCKDDLTVCLEECTPLTGKYACYCQKVCYKATLLCLNSCVNLSGWDAIIAILSNED